MQKEYLKRGYVVIPVHRDKRPAVPYWKGLTLEKSAAQRFDGHGIALLTGSVNGLVVLDVDVAHGGVDFLRSGLAREMPRTGPLSRTGGGGYHFFFRYDSETVGRSRYRLGNKGLDFKSENGYVVVPPSIHANGNKYRWIRSLFTHQLPEVPAAVLALLQM